MSTTAPAQPRLTDIGPPSYDKFLPPIVKKNYGQWKYHENLAPGVLCHVTATIPTKIGGYFNYIAKNMSFEFVRPVFVGDTITAEATIMKVEREEKLLRGEIEGLCHNQHGKVVLVFKTSGVIKE